MAVALLRPCHLCGETDGLPRHDLVLATEPSPVGLSMHLGCAENVLTCPECGPQIATTIGLAGVELRTAVLAHHGTGEHHAA